MSYNVLEKYIEITTREINEYMKLIFENMYLKRISDKYIYAYLDVRFYNFYHKDENLTFRKNFMNAIKQAEQRILIQFPDDKKIIENMAIFYYFILYFDKISYRKGLEENIDKLYKLRMKLLKKQDEEFKEKFYKTYQKYVEEKEQFILKFETENFFLKITDYKNAKNVNRVVLKYNIKFPKIYSTWALERTFSSGIISEDKLNVEYSLISALVIKDIMRGNFKKQYIVEFIPSLLKKSKKLKSILNIINNPAVQDKVSLKIKYQDFEENKEEVYELMRNGYRFAIIIDDTMDTSYATLQKLNAFSYILISRELKRYEAIMADKVVLRNIIEI